MPTAPELTLTDVTDETYEPFLRAIERGFQEAHHEESLEFSRRYFTPARFFGFAADGRWASTFGSFPRRMTVPGGATVPAAAVTVVTVHPPFRRRGLLSAMMQEEFARCARRGEPIATLWASEGPIYGRFGYGLATDGVRLAAATRELAFRPGTEVGGWCDEVEQDAFITAARPVWERFGTTRPGSLDRDEKWWRWRLFDAEWERQGASLLRHVLHTDDNGAVDGLATYRFKDGYSTTGPDGETQVGLVHAENPIAYAALWRYLIDLDLTRRISMRSAPADEPLRHLLLNARALETAARDNVFVRLIDVAAALQARRYATDLDVVLEVDDPLLPANHGRFRLRGSATSAAVERTGEAADIALDVRDLATVYLGGPTLAQLRATGRVRELTPGAITTASQAFRSESAPWCADDF